jgi:hypothetical protein
MAGDAPSRTSLVIMRGLMHTCRQHPKTGTYHMASCALASIFFLGFFFSPPGPDPFPLALLLWPVLGIAAWTEEEEPPRNAATGRPSLLRSRWSSSPTYPTSQASFSIRSSSFVNCV